ncbi:MAG: C-GCAxxG-C-C family protein [Deltaproteobacteria bacterium]|nr:C-GCAxxG-C-C family protein [Deltaproteobacteria bacterium]
MPNSRQNNHLPVTVNDLAIRAVTLFKEGLDCETAVVTVFDQYLGTQVLDGLEPSIRRIGLGFQVPCGALMGSRRVMAKVLDHDPQLPQLRQELEKLFVIKHKATTCQYLTARIKWGEHHNHCGKYVYTAVESLYAILEQRLGHQLAKLLNGLEAPETKH